MLVDPSVQRNLHLDQETDFTVFNLPYGIYSTALKSKRAGVAIGSGILDLAVLFELGVFSSIFPVKDKNLFHCDVLNEFIALGKPYWQEIRNVLKEIISGKSTFIQSHQVALFDQQALSTLYLPVKINNYTDFYSSEAHAINAGKLFRPQGDPLLPNWKNLPVAYHGRTSSIILSGSPVYRPWGQYLADGKPVFGPTQELDFELELGFIIGQENTLGRPIPVEEAEDYVFGSVLLNDWSARDIQRWEYQPLGPFLGKNFATSISPWIIPMEALNAFHVKAREQHPAVLNYLNDPLPYVFDIGLQVYLEYKNQPSIKLVKTNASNLYWTLAQQIAHHTVNGCNLQVGDLLGTGTISGPDPGSWGSLLEITYNGKKPLSFDHSGRTYLEDGDQVMIKSVCARDDIRLGFGELKNKIIPNPYHPKNKSD
jgi:fumarylacetoacetase